jgi:hypothetical protein
MLADFLACFLHRLRNPSIHRLDFQPEILVVCHQEIHSCEA